jgi:hypothetical protein
MGSSCATHWGGWGGLELPPHGFRIHILFQMRMLIKKKAFVHLGLTAWWPTLPLSVPPWRVGGVRVVMLELGFSEYPRPHTLLHRRQLVSGELPREGAHLSLRLGHEFLKELFKFRVETWVFDPCDVGRRQRHLPRQQLQDRRIGVKDLEEGNLPLRQVIEKKAMYGGGGRKRRRRKRARSSSRQPALRKRTQRSKLPERCS